MATNVLRRAGVALLIAIAVCGAIAVPVAAQAPATPRQVVMAFYIAVNQSEDEAFALMSEPLVAQVKKSGGLPKFVSERAGGEQVRGVQILKEDITGQTAVVSYILHLVDGATRRCEDSVVNEDGKWKMTVKPPAKRK